MKSLIRITILVLALVPMTAQSAEPETWVPPPFELADADGTAFSFPGGIQRPTVILFWATWCPFCKAFMPHLQSILDEYGDRVEVFALHIWDDEDPAAFLAEHGFEFRLFPKADDVAEAWGVKGTPGIFMVDAKGELAFSRGAIPLDAYRLTEEEAKELKRVQIAARVAPLWAARMRMALDGLVRE